MGRDGVPGFHHHLAMGYQYAADGQMTAVNATFLAMLDKWAADGTEQTTFRLMSRDARAGRERPLQASFTRADRRPGKAGGCFVCFGWVPYSLHFAAE